jgi:transcriptional regulator with XRE-family HTH domain
MTRSLRSSRLPPSCSKARLRAGLSQAELASRMGTSQSTIARLESGQSLPSTKTLLRYAEATGSKAAIGGLMRHSLTAGLEIVQIGQKGELGSERWSDIGMHGGALVSVFKKFDTADGREEAMNLWHED